MMKLYPSLLALYKRVPVINVILIFIWRLPHITISITRLHITQMRNVLHNFTWALLWIFPFVSSNLDTLTSEAPNTYLMPFSEKSGDTCKVLSSASALIKLCGRVTQRHSIIFNLPLRAFYGDSLLLMSTDGLKIACLLKLSSSINFNRWSKSRCYFSMSPMHSLR